MKISVIAALIISVNFGFLECARILGIFPLPGSSHFAMHGRIMRELAKSGHEVDVVSHFVPKTPIPRYNAISLAGIGSSLHGNMSMELIEQMKKSLIAMIPLGLYFLGDITCSEPLNASVIKDLKNTTKKYDLLITEVFMSDCFLGFAHHFNIPSITLTSSVMLPWGNDRIGNIDNPSYIPNYYMPYPSKMSFWQRLINTAFVGYCKLMFEIVTQFVHNKEVKKFFGPDTPNLQDLARNTSLVLVNSHFSVNPSRPTVPNFVEVGGIHIEEPKPPPKDIEDFLNTSKNTIYVSMGSMVMVETFPKEKLQSMFDALEELPYNVLFKANKDDFPEGLKYPSNINFKRWLPQLDVLCHPNVKLFITHGGLMGTQEAVYCGVPQLGIPLFADQDLNIQAYETMGFAIKVAYEDITKETILNASKRLLEDPSYKEKCALASKLFKDRPSTAIQTALYWIDYVIKYNGAPHLRTVGADLPWYQYHLLDVFIVLVIIVVSCLYLIFVVSKFVIKMFKKKQQKFKSN